MELSLKNVYEKRGSGIFLNLKIKELSFYRVKDRISILIGIVNEYDTYDIPSGITQAQMTFTEHSHKNHFIWQKKTIFADVNDLGLEPEIIRYELEEVEFKGGFNDRMPYTLDELMDGVDGVERPESIFSKAGFPSLKELFDKDSNGKYLNILPKGDFEFELLVRNEQMKAVVSNLEIAGEKIKEQFLI